MDTSKKNTFLNAVVGVVLFAIVASVGALAFSYTNAAKRDIKENPGSIRELRHYTTYCLKGKTLMNIENFGVGASFIYELDDAGKPVPCKP